MGNPKRKALAEKGEASSAGPAKKPRGEDFTGQQFKVQLKDPQTMVSALETFISIAKMLPQTGLYDVVEGYIKISVECSEIFQLLSGEKRTEHERLLIFKALEAILLRTAGDLSHFHVVGTNIIKKVLNSHMKLIYESLNPSSYKMTQTCLNLMSAMVAQGPDAARDFYSHFDFNKKSLYGLVKIRSPKGLPDIRLAYIQFALSFLIAGDDNTIARVLEMKEFLPVIFSTGLKEDRISTINLLLSTLGTKVVHNIGITKTQKVRFFTGYLLNNVASLYRWNGIADVSTENVKPTEEAAKTIVRELVHNFLMDLCCSLKHGINFYDPSLGTLGRGGNLTLLNFLLGLKTAVDDDMVAELVVNILKVCPDLLTKYFKEVTYSFVPRLKSAWLSNIRLLRKIYEAQPEISPAFKTKEFIPLSRMLSMVMVTTVPNVCNKIMFTQGLKLENKSVNHTVLSLISTILKRALKNIDHCLNKDVWQESGIYTPAMMEEFVRLYREAVSKLLPDLNNIVCVWQSLGKQKPNEDGGLGKKTSPEDEITETIEVDHKHDDAETTLLKAILLQVICLYQMVVPHVVIQCTFDFSKLLKGIISEEGFREEVPPVLQYYILKVALELPANKFVWLKGQESPSGGERSVFYLLMKMFVTSKHSQLKASTKLLIMKILRDTGVFEYTWKELELWLEQLDNITEEGKEVVIQFLECVLLHLVTNPYSYTDKAAEFVQEASTLHATMMKQEADNVSIPVSHIDDILDMVDVLMEDSEGLDEEIGFSLSEDMILLTFPFSAIVPAALDSRNKLLLGTENESGESVVSYLIAVLTDLLHTQRDPLALCLMLQYYDNLQLSSTSLCARLYQFNKYYSLWIPEQARETLEFKAARPTEASLVVGSAFSTLLTSTYERGSTFLLEENIQAKLIERIAQLPMQQILLSVKQVMLYLRTTVENFAKFGKTSGPALLQLFMNLLSHLLSHCYQLDTCNQQKCEAVQAESAIFLDEESLATLELANDTTLEDVLMVIFRHPTLESWYLALEQQTLPSHALNPVFVKLLATHFSAGVLTLLKVSAPMLRDMHRLDIFSKYSEAITKSVLKELQTLKTGSPTAYEKPSAQLEALYQLHPYLDGVQLRDITLAFLALPKLTLLAQGSKKSPQKGKHLSFLGEILKQLITGCYQEQSQQGELLLSLEYVKGMSALLPALVIEELETVFLQALQKDPVMVHVVELDLLTYCLNRKTKTCLSIVALLIQNSSTHLLHFELWCLQGLAPCLPENLSLFLPLVHTYLQSCMQGDFSRSSKVSRGVMNVLRKALWRELQNNLLGDDPQGLEMQEVLSKLVPYARAKDFKLLVAQLPSILQRPDKFRSWIVSDSISLVLEKSVEELEIWKKTLLGSCIKWLTASYSGSNNEEKTQDAEKSMLSRLNELLHSVNEVDPVDWQKFVKQGLKFRYQDYTFLKILHACIQLLYKPENSLCKKLVQLPLMYVMITQHSLFLPTILQSKEDDTNIQVKEVLVDLISTIVKICPSVCESSHFAVLLGGYGATLSVLDQKILLLLRLYEKNDLSLINFRMLLWGHAAVEHHKTCKSLGKSLWQQPSVGEILCLLDREKMMKTILHFPQNRRLLLKEDAQDIFKDKSKVDFDELYDPCFLLHLFSELTRPEFVVDCHKFVDSNALGLTVSALSSYDPQMRAAAYYVLASYYSHLEGARFREQPQLLYLLDVVQNGIRKQNLRFTYSLTLFIAKTALQILKPEEHMYMKINKFLLSHEDLYLNKLPGFYNFFYSSDLEYRIEQEWIFDLLRQGIRDTHCYDLYSSQRIFHIILSFFNSPLCDETMQIWILEILQNAAQITKAAFEIVQEHSLLTWILHILGKKFLENQVLSNIISLLHTLWLSNLGNKRMEIQDDHPCELVAPQSPKLLPLQFVNEFLYVMVVLVRYLRPTLDSVQITHFFSTLNSVLRYRETVLEAFKEMDRLTVNEHIFSTKDVLILLHKWSLIMGDSKLQEDLKTTIEKYQVKELMKMIKDRNKPPAPARSKAQRSRKKMEVDPEGTTDPELKASSLKKCRDLLRSILTHWEPIFPVSERETDSEQVHLAPCPESEAVGLVSATAVLVASWGINSLTDPTLDVQGVPEVLRWFKRSILPHQTVVTELFRDVMWRNSIFKLYGQLSSAKELKAATWNILCLFNTIMLHLMVSQGPIENSYHEVIETISLSSTDEEDKTKQAAAAFLVSLYIKDIWPGAKPVNTFLAHVRMICDATDLVSGDEGETLEQEEAIAALCENITVAT
ncbi:nucleolar pre-ribosomal-associated protein 1 isoform X1 [Monodelphis domestica]|uniref:nucleolar pre-ribosomal-associated protein 1 isoform X1 n=1 Tax=Monodelphis domestica TaxID=13616 RepID=UPI0024E264D1|nr:nucleolar pre-ribosomal-associated protein 1 isoform X1 [Monodelphis domestica]